MGLYYFKKVFILDNSSFNYFNRRRINYYEINIFCDKLTSGKFDYSDLKIIFWIDSFDKNFDDDFDYTKFGEIFDIISQSYNVNIKKNVCVKIPFYDVSYKYLEAVNTIKIMNKLVSDSDGIIRKIANMRINFYNNLIQMSDEEKEQIKFIKDSYYKGINHNVKVLTKE